MNTRITSHWPEPAKYEVALSCPSCGSGHLFFALNQYKVHIDCQDCHRRFVFENVAQWNRLASSERAT